jgi:hypothetical protein
VTETNIYTQLAKAQGEFEQPKRTKIATVRPRDKAPYSFAYASLDEVLAAVRPALAKYGLFLTQGLVTIEGAEQIRTAIYYGEQYVENFWPLIVTEAGAQKHGASGTFARRYGVSALLGLAPEEDDDNNTEEGNDRTIADRKTAPKAPPANGNKVKPLPDTLRQAAEGRRSEPPHDPYTGVIPQAIEYPARNKASALAWGARLVDELAHAGTRQVAEAWITANAKQLGFCKEDHPQCMTRVEAQIAAMRERLPGTDNDIPADFMPAYEV